MRAWTGVWLLGAVILIAAPGTAALRVYEEDGKYVEVGGRIQLQYAREEPSDGPTVDDLFFRRLRPYIAGSVTEDWYGKIQVDFGKAQDGDEVAVKDAYLEYRGWENLSLYIGNTKTPFSREFLASSKRQQTVERVFVGQHNFGNPDRQLGFRLDGHNEGKTLTWAVAIGAEDHDPDVDRVDMDTPANQSSDWNQGVVYAARVDLHPWGFVKFDQGDFDRGPLKANFSLAAFAWSNDDDNNTHTDRVDGAAVCTGSGRCDLDGSDGLEISAGLRGRGFSVDAEYNVIHAELIDGAFTGGVYVAGETELTKYQLEGGYVLPGDRFEVVGRYDAFDADGFATTWTGLTVGVNYFWNEHDVKVQALYRQDSDVAGVRGDDLDSIVVQWQFVFE